MNSLRSIVTVLLVAAADRLVTGRLLLPEDAAAYTKWVESAAIAKRFAP